MLVKMFKHGKGGSSGVMNYLLGKKGDRDGARIIEGDRQLTSMLIDNSPFKQKYTSGVLSFERSSKSVSEEKKKEIIQGFESTIFAGLEREQYNILWIEHNDKDGRLELNFVIPNRELNSGKSLNPYYHRKDLLRVDSWKNMVNIRNGFSDPTSPLRARESVNFDNFKRDEQKEYVSNKLLSELKENDGRWQVVERLREIEIDGECVKVDVRDREKSITVFHPSFKGRNNALRLKGYMFERDFRFSPKTEKELLFKQFENEEHRQKILLERSEYVHEKGMKTATTYNRNRYPSRPLQIQNELVATAEVEEEQKNIPQPRSRGMRFR